MVPSSASSQPAAGSESVVNVNSALVEALAAASRRFDATGPDPERNCWLAVHEHIHGVLPSEYDIREVPEELYLAVLAVRRQEERAG